MFVSFISNSPGFFLKKSIVPQKKFFVSFVCVALCRVSLCQLPSDSEVSFGSQRESHSMCVPLQSPSSYRSECVSYLWKYTVHIHGSPAVCQLSVVLAWPFQKLNGGSFTRKQFSKSLSSFTAPFRVKLVFC